VAEVPDIAVAAVNGFAAAGRNGQVASLEVGYGVLDQFVKRDELPDEKRQECEKMGWRGVLVFRELYRFEPPLRIKDTVIGPQKPGEGASTASQSQGSKLILF
jgi:hypothetical protein